MSSHLCVPQWGCTAASGAGWADPGSAYLQHLFAGNFQETFKYRGETFPLGKSVEMQCLLLESDLSMFPWQPGTSAGRSSGRGRCDAALQRQCESGSVPQQLPGTGQGTGRQVGGTSCHCQLERSRGTEPFTAEAVPLFLPCNLGLVQLLPSHAPPLLPAQSLCRSCTWSRCQGPAAGECQRFHCLFAKGVGD